MLTDTPSDDLRSRNEIVGASEHGLEMRIDGRVETAPWAVVTGVSAGQAKLNRISDIWILVLAVEIRFRNREHVLIVGEVDAAWLPLTSLLHEALADVPPFEEWAASVLTASGPLELYSRV